MKVSLNLAQKYSTVDLKSIPRDELLKCIGAQLGAVEEVIDWAPKFEGAAIVKVVECTKHENADKLSVCRVDDGGKNQSVERGDDGLVQVVCGAPNVRAGMYAIWLAPGATVPSSRDIDPFVLEAREIRGVVSNGMLASAQELDISDDHTGIVNVTAEDAGKEPVPGEPLTNYFGLDDFVIDCENKMFTHRPDCFGNLGVARELAGISGYKFEDPEWYWKKPQFESRQDITLSIKNDAPELVPRFMTVTMNNVTVRPSPMWLQATLARVGIKPINNVVDVTNYVMHLTGQPTHAFDYDKIKERSNEPGIFPRLSTKGERLTLLGKKEIELTGEEIVISTDKQAVALAGVMGGFDTEVDENTKSIIIECATFDMYSIRRTSMRFGLFTDAVTRFNKGQSPMQNDRVLAYLMKMMGEITGAQQASDVYDLKSGYEQAHLDQSLNGFMRVEAGFINERLGTDLSNQEICELLQRVHFAAYEEDGKLEITAPFWRMDIEIPEDIVEEVGRLYGYDKLPVGLPKRSAKPTPKNRLFDFKQHVRYQLKEAGANEVLTYSFVHGDLMKKMGVDADKWAYHLRNAISPDLQYYRTSLVPSLLAKVHANIKAQAGSTDNQFALFEIGKIHIKSAVGEEDLPLEFQNIAMVISADDKTAKAQQAGSAYYLAKKYVDRITDGQAEYVELTDYEHPVYSHYQPGRVAGVIVDGDKVGVIGELRPEVRQALKLPEFTAGFEIEIEQLMLRLKPKKYQPLPEFPGTSKDVTLPVASDSTWSDARASLEQALVSVIDGHRFDIEPRDIFQADNSDQKNITLRINLSHPNKTMTTEEATRLADEAAAIATKGLTSHA